ncbi:2OG-Fe dioxygenase family protein [Chitinolyticbacter meiyuanensis]|uniref:2OG-Fe dioxygenase family protein n=1 Tax=Chitinolyticbacter meiyuanensis TaxID=682798 RepID=UPI0011E5CE39|nr:2OG-Fe dioxygenase family protein [Chitinolyticbacter meiyuanensis]
MMDAVAPMSLADTMSAGLVTALRSKQYAFVPGRSLQAACGLEPEVWAEFADCWERLTLDHYMGDGGRYRYRRYGAFLLGAHGELVLQPHGPYEQPRYINTLNGGVARHFDPLEPSFVHNRFLRGLLRALGRAFDAAEGTNAPWLVRLHPYRIRADGAMLGQPTPEGLHRDGVDFICTLMVERHNVEGGETRITDAAGNLLHALTLSDPLDLLVANDVTTMHGVSPITAARPDRAAWRDVLVIAYARP